MGKKFDFRLASKTGWSLVNRYFLCKEDEESIDHILFHYLSVMILWK